MSNRLKYMDSSALSQVPQSPNLIMPPAGDCITFDNGQKVNWLAGLKKHFTKDAMMTFDQLTIDSTGAFLIGELERLDPTLHDPLAAVTWSRDIDLREDVTMADEVSSYTNSSYAAAGGIIPGGKNWISKDANAISGIALDIGKTSHPLYLWGMELRYTLPELASAQKLGRPIDLQKYEGMKLKWQMDIDEQVYIGDTTFATKGMLNNASVTATNVAQAGATSPTSNTTSLKWIDKTPAAILADVNTILQNAYTASAFAVIPDRLLVPPVEFGYLVSQLVSTAGNISILEFLRNNSLCNAANGRPLEILPNKWLTGRGASSSDRMVAYVKKKDFLRFPLVPLQKTPIEFRSLHQIITYYGRLGVVEVVYPETMYYMDGIA